jgi:NAD(P)-dependent dehydrogenase (short-subunit alcohol dehydrogenase family)
MRTLHGKRVLVTGAASGIGRCLARELAAQGAHVLVADRDEAGAQRTAGELGAGGARALGYGCDVTDPASIAALRDRVHADGGPIDLLVNNAGVVFGGAFLDVPLERHVATYDVNTLGLVAVTHAFLPDLLARPDAHVVNVASASGYVGLPFGTTYASSKWAVIGFSESLALELELQGHTHMHVTTVCPSYVATGMFDGVRPPLTTTLLTPERLASQVVRAVLRNKAKVRAPWLVALTPLLKGVLPDRLFVRAAGFLGVNTSMMHWRGRGGDAARPQRSVTNPEPPRAAAGH